LFSIDPSGTTCDYDSAEWENPSVNIQDFLTQETTYESYSRLKTSSIKICRGDTSHCYQLDHNLAISLQKFFTDDIRYIDFSRHIIRE
jgi:hypothetical protein